ncbi:MAG: DUF5103 domain-containing protein [Bacteroidales bacterium]|jgi:hypothetical protein|nr:DUF5103 domain-containing protein [Bacteroidales bacterium]
MSLSKIFLDYFFLIVIGLFCPVIQAQYNPPDGIYPDAVFNESVKTVRLIKTEWEISYPISHIEDENPMELSFDELSRNAKNYSYTIIHCDADWRQSRLIPTDYMTGFSVNYIRNYEYSFNTQIPYIHYRVSIPNEDVTLKLSGNYVIMVYENGNERNPILCKRFCITESAVTISATAYQARLTAYRDEWQQVDFVARTLQPIENPYQDIKTVIIKNGQWNMALTGIRPLFVRQNELDYRQEKATLFKAGNEFRPLDTKSIRYSSTRMTKIEFEPPTYHFYLYPDESRNTSRYLFYEDFNGRYSVQSEKTNNPDIETDYVYVHFTLKAPQDLNEGQVYVYGAFTNFNCTPDNLMRYNPEKGQYEARILLKQGYYNYGYAFLPFKHPVIDDTMLEGSFYDTENDYIIYMYHRSRTSRYDRLIGVNVVNTLHK